MRRRPGIVQRIEDKLFRSVDTSFFATRLKRHIIVQTAYENTVAFKIFGGNRR
jgi:hypothetical protein